MAQEGLTQAGRQAGRQAGSQYLAPPVAEQPEAAVLGPVPVHITSMSRDSAEWLVVSNRTAYLPVFTRPARPKRSRLLW